MKKIRDIRGFSLVELIIVIAIMAVLTGLLAPQYLRYVERARIQKAITNTKTVTDAITALITDAAANESDLYTQLMNAVTGTGDDAHQTEAYNGQTVVKLDFSLSASDTLVKLILDEIGDSSSINGIIYFYVADDIPSFSYEMHDGNIAVDYNPPASVAASRQYTYVDGSYHAYYINK